MFVRSNGDTVDFDLVENSCANGEFRLVWMFDGDSGDALGTLTTRPNPSADDLEALRLSALELKNYDELGAWEDAVAWTIANASADSYIDLHGFYWRTEAKAKKVAKKILKALKAGPSHGLAKTAPAWERKALEAGWTPPKGKG